MTQRIEDLIEVFGNSRSLTSLEIIERLSSKGYSALEARMLISKAVKAGVIKKLKSKAKEVFVIADRVKVEEN